MSTAELKAPFQYFGGKSRIADRVWRLFGRVTNYVEPFFGSGAVLLSRPRHQGIETVNDINGYISNFWRAIRDKPDQVADHADWPVNENDLHARHVWLIGEKETMRANLEGDPHWSDPKAAGWWVWGICNWIGHGWCDDKTGPWWVEDGQLVHLSDAGQGVSRQRVHLGNAGIGVSGQRVHLGEWFKALSDRLRRVRVCCGDWTRVTGRSVTTIHGVTGIFLDPPYLHGTDDGSRDDRCYGEHDSGTVAHDVRQWCLDNGDNRLLRIVLCGYDGEHDLPAWRTIRWKATGGPGRDDVGNRYRERLWVSPHCEQPERLLF